MRNPKVFISVGHGGSDPGAVANGFVEKDINLVMAMAHRDELVRYGVKVAMSRTTDEDDSTREEIRECNAFGPDLAVSHHNNAGRGDGAEVYYHIGGGTGEVLAQHILDEIVASGQNSRGIKTRTRDEDGLDYYGFIRDTYCPAVIVESAFLDNDDDVKIIDTKAEQEAMGRAAARGTLKTLREMGFKIEEPAQEEPEAEAVFVTVKLPVIANGSYGDAARAAMVLLSDLGYYPGILGSSDKLFGSKAEAAAKDFQRNRGLYVDGVVGVETWPALIGD